MNQGLTSLIAFCRENKQSYIRVMEGTHNRYYLFRYSPNQGSFSLALFSSDGNRLKSPIIFKVGKKAFSSIDPETMVKLDNHLVRCLKDNDIIGIRSFLLNNIYLQSIGRDQIFIDRYFNLDDQSNIAFNLTFSGNNELIINIALKNDRKAVIKSKCVVTDKAKMLYIIPTTILDHLVRRRLDIQQTKELFSTLKELGKNHYNLYLDSLA